ncbi:MAG: hypothetical protein A2857_06035 [Candidatus Levybacteria bacterium RIFCSPHIGHO2_01_FULL_36_15]|nr:MAG: hypothetical protein A2857_06035 [Candidatus Levybacteria bacterium RIFCSPHIGHO2_01_FULL_36_15]OGH37545.1 MAG: hypothetical protein A2905_01240 [Candidatus Levybacteria bacterium RIFCSPLOWO2_01_FULL_36_10]
MIVGPLIFIAAIFMLIGLLFLKLIERMIYEQYKQSVPSQKISPTNTFMKYYYEAVEIIENFFKRYFITHENAEKIMNLKIKLKRYVTYLVTGKV